MENRVKTKWDYVDYFSDFKTVVEAAESTTAESIRTKKSFLLLQELPIHGICRDFHVNKKCTANFNF
jgi:hypothetical protein